MPHMLTLRLEPQLALDLQHLCELSGKSKSDIVRQALQQHLFKERWALLTQDMVRHARGLGVYTDDAMMRLCQQFRADAAKARAPLDAP